LVVNLSLVDCRGIVSSNPKKFKEGKRKSVILDLDSATPIF